MTALAVFFIGNKMVASTDIKFYVHTNNNMPQLQNAYGSMINVLDACLINGINIGTVSSLTVSGTTVTALFSSSHNLMQYQVIKITGANQIEFNGEHRILTVPGAQSVTFELAAPPSATTATGTISASLPPLGWEKPFNSTNVSDGGKAAYRSKNLLLPSRPFLRVVDELDPAYTATYAKYAKVGIVEDMLDINTMIGVQAPFDTANQNKNWIGTGSGTGAYNGWAKWHYARNQPFTSGSGNTEMATPSGAARKWLVVGSSDYFYIMPSCVDTTSSAHDYGVLYGFGVFDSAINADATNTFLSATLNYITAAAGTTPATQTGLSSQAANTLVQRKYDQSNSPALCSTITTSNATNIIPGSQNYVSNINTIFAPAVLLENTLTPNIVRGQCVGMYWLLQQEPLPELQVLVEKSEIFIAKKITASSTIRGEVVFSLGVL